ncbi:hypothetical protein [Flavobacterium sp. CLA17]|uniref:hypothetical protein n=1 Tax=Flavobacterium sp. CLA17 TaxID=2724135 RepID=UPI001492BD2A|nr:hypothetical protein [Flavobacterium sp. CLA17]QSB29080.1 hypothetical protein HAV12_010180 [Flavobacterium sp. CLA17]
MTTTIQSEKQTKALIDVKRAQSQSRRLSGLRSVTIENLAERSKFINHFVK